MIFTSGICQTEQLTADSTLKGETVQAASSCWDTLHPTQSFGLGENFCHRQQPQFIAEGRFSSIPRGYIHNPLHSLFAQPPFDYTAKLVLVLPQDERLGE